MKSFIVSFTTMFFAEIGDKTMLAIVLLARKFGIFSVLFGAFIGTAIVMLVPLALGFSINKFFSKEVELIIGGGVFILMGLYFIYAGIKGGEEEEEEVPEKEKMGFPAWLTVAITLFLMEFGDKTQILAFGDASKFGATLSTWAGLTLGMYVADTLSLLFLPFLEKVPEKVFNLVSGVIFLVLGILVISGLV